MKKAMGGGALTRIAVTDAAWVAIVATLPATVHTGTIQRSFSGEKILTWLPNEVVEKLSAERRWWESHSDVILRLANDRDNVARPADTRFYPARRRPHRNDPALVQWQEDSHLAAQLGGGKAVRADVGAA
jgi:hypothetical protein